MVVFVGVGPGVGPGPGPGFTGLVGLTALRPQTN